MVQKCEACKKNKVSSLLAIPCKCEYKNLCASCRPPENHACKFDYKKAAQNELMKQNPKIESDKNLVHI
jgi:hypothetical protein